MKEEHQGRVTVMAAADGGCGGGGALENGRKEGKNEGEGHQKERTERREEIRAPRKE